jgi:hypothetical protein
MIGWIWANKEWLFSGVGVVLVVGAVRLLRFRAQARTIKPRPACDSGTREQQANPSVQRFDRTLVERACGSFPEFLEIYNALQDRFFEQSEFLRAMRGVQVNWIGHVVSVHEHSDGRVSVMISDTTEPRYNAYASVVFEPEWKTKLFALRKSDKVQTVGAYRDSTLPFMLDGQSIQLVELRVA